MREKEQVFLTEEFQLIKIEETRELKKSPLQHHSINCSKHDLLMNAIIIGWKCKIKQDICIASNCVSLNIIFTKGKIISLQWRKLVASP